MFFVVFFFVEHQHNYKSFIVLYLSLIHHHHFYDCFCYNKKIAFTKTSKQNSIEYTYKLFSILCFVTYEFKSFLNFSKINKIILDYFDGTTKNYRLWCFCLDSISISGVVTLHFVITGNVQQFPNQLIQLSIPTPPPSPHPYHTKFIMQSVLFSDGAPMLKWRFWPPNNDFLTTSNEGSETITRLYYPMARIRDN